MTLLARYSEKLHNPKPGKLPCLFWNIVDWPSSGRRLHQILNASDLFMLFHLIGICRGCQGYTNTVLTDFFEKRMHFGKGSHFRKIFSFEDFA